MHGAKGVVVENLRLSISVSEQQLYAFPESCPQQFPFPPQDLSCCCFTLVVGEPGAAVEMPNPSDIGLSPGR